MLNISLADYGVGNLHSLKKSLENCGADVTIVTSMDELLDAECIAFPGVGAFDRTMEALLPYREDIRRKLESGTPGIGICIGTQILTDRSQEGSSPGLGFIAGEVLRLRTRRVPHMGWNVVDSDDPLMEGIENRHFYFANSYYCEPDDRTLIRGTTEYDGFVFPTMFRKNNFIGTQFHPEKSSGSGLRFISNFIKFAEECL